MDGSVRTCSISSYAEERRRVANDIFRYYNGTLSMEMDIVDWPRDEEDFEDEKQCSLLLNTTIKLSFDAVLGFTKTLQEDVNPLMFVLTAWEEGRNLTSTSQRGAYRWEMLPIRTASLRYVPPSPPNGGRESTAYMHI